MAPCMHWKWTTAARLLQHHAARLAAWQPEEPSLWPYSLRHRHIYESYAWSNRAPRLLHLGPLVVPVCPLKQHCLEGDEVEPCASKLHQQARCCSRHFFGPQTCCLCVWVDGDCYPRKRITTRGRNGFACTYRRIIPIIDSKTNVYLLKVSNFSSSRSTRNSRPIRLFQFSPAGRINRIYLRSGDRYIG